MVDHTSINVSDLVSAKEKYSKALKPLGYKIYLEIPEKKVLGFAHPCKFLFGLIKFDKPDFWINEAGVGGGTHIAFTATKQQCDEFYKAAIEAGFKDNGAPGYRPQYHKNYYGAYVLDVDGNNVEAVCHRA